MEEEARVPRGAACEAFEGVLLVNPDDIMRPCVVLSPLKL